MYNKDIEASRQGKQLHDSNQKKHAQERLAKNATYNKKFKPKKED
jgi:hypothetical protein